MEANEIDVREFGPEAHHEERIDHTEEHCQCCWNEFYSDLLIRTTSGPICQKCIKEYSNV